MSDLAPWTTAPYVLCEHCQRETLVEGAVVDLVVGREVTCAHCGAILRVNEVQDVRNTRCVVVRYPDGSELEDDLTPVETPRLAIVSS